MKLQDQTSEILLNHSFVEFKQRRGITDFLVICDETNNTPDVIDAMSLSAISLSNQPSSINFIGLTFVATRTGVSFEVAGRV